ncbi:la protein 1-like [Iris pallida]|uniref:La protein 1-like n=1 Tax=Iris pallida TaxID=29817 RepID=A0AAX6H147_IRIPA|nr:la protein 1-like [Iris pallida]
MFIDFSMGEESGYVRFENPDAAVKARAAAVLTDEGGLVVKNSIATLEPLSGDTEKEYWSLLCGSQERNRDSKGNYRGRGRSNRGRQYDGKRHCQGGYAGDGRRNKTQKSSSGN